MFKKVTSLLLSLVIVVITLSTAIVGAFASGPVYVVAGVSELCGSTWDPSPDTSPDNIMESQTDGTYQKVYTNVAVMNNYQLKIVENADDGSQNWYGIDGGDDSFTFNVKSVCDVTITFDPATLKITVTGDGVEIPTELEVESMRTVGNGDRSWLNGIPWDPAADENLMKEVAPKVYEITYTDLDEFDNYKVKFAANGSWDANWGGVYEGSGIESEAVFNSSDNITIEVPYERADVTLRLDLTNFDFEAKTGAKFTVTVVDKTGSEPVSTTTAPSVSAYATKAQLMDDTFAPDADGYDTNIGKLAFGIDEDGRLQNWYILGKDTGVDGDNTVIFAESPISIGAIESRGPNKIYDSQWGCTYPDGTTISEVYRNHYGASFLRETMNEIATDTSYFTIAEQGLMNYTTVTTTDAFNGVDYTTADKLYALQGALDETIIYAGSSDQIALATESYWSSGDNFWLRSPADATNGLSAVPNDKVVATTINDDGTYIQPALNLDLTDVLFSSAAAANPSTDGPSVGTIDTDKAMALRLDGSGMGIGTVEYDSQTNTIKAQKGSISGEVALVVQGKNIVQKQNETRETDWFYSELVGGEYSISANLIKTALGLSSLNLEKCKIWLETEGTDGMRYAANGVEKIQTVEITDIETPTANTALDTSALCATKGVSSTTPSVTWTPAHTTAGYNTSYTASVTLTADEGYEFTDSTTATVNGNAATSVAKNPNGTLTVTYKFSAIPDTTAPTGEISIGTNKWIGFLNNITFNLFFKNTQNVTITASDNSGDAVAIEYLLSDKELTVADLDKATFTAYSNTFSINPNNEYVIYAKLTDARGNAAYINSNGIVLDSVAPVISGIENGKTYCSAQTVTVTEKYIASVTVNGNPVTLNANNQFTLSAAEGTQKIVATDKAGNVSVEMIVTVNKGHTDKDKDKGHICDVCGESLSAQTDSDPEIGIVSDSDTESGTASDTSTDNSKTAVDKDMKSPQTGDNSHMALWIALLLVSGGLLTVTGVYSKKKTNIN